MKAKEYFEKYFGDIDDGEALIKAGNEPLVQLMFEMGKEVITICETRHSLSNSSVDGALKEMNQRFNAVADMCEKKYGFRVLKRNGFLTYWTKEFEKKKI